MYQNKDHTNQKHIVIKSNNIDVSNLKKVSEITKKISNLIHKGDNLLLYGELGVGKTTFTKSIINYLQLKNNIETTEILSPTFNILNEYQINNLNVKHYDMYRINQEEELNNLGLFEEKDIIISLNGQKYLNLTKLKVLNFIFLILQTMKIEI